MRRPGARTLAVGAMLAVACAAAPQISTLNGADAREAFLSQMDAALASRDAAAIARLSDVAGWRAAGHPDPDPSKLLLPQGAITRSKSPDDPQFDESEVLYRNEQGAGWRLRLKHDSAADKWLAILQSELCPRRSGMARGIGFEGRGGGGQPEQSSAWTPLECWPLPK